MDKDQKIIHRSWDRMDLIGCLSGIKATVGAEIGVYNGDFSAALIKTLGLEKLYLIDPYKPYQDDSIVDDEETHECRYKMVCSKFKNDPVEIIRKTSQDALNLFDDNSLDFVYIDADHSYESVSFDINNWSKKVKDNGIIAGHDYDLCHADVINGVNDFFIQEKYQVLIVCDQESIWIIPKGNRI